MPVRSRQLFLSLLVLALLLAPLAGCGPQPVPTAAPPPPTQPDPTLAPPAPTTAVAVVPTATPPLGEGGQGSFGTGTGKTYKHPSGAFEMPELSVTKDESDVATLFYVSDTAIVFVFFANSEVSLDDASLAAVAGRLLEQSFGSGYTVQAAFATPTANGYLAPVEYPDASGTALGEIFVAQGGGRDFMAFLLGSYDQTIQNGFEQAMQLFKPGAGLSLADGSYDSGFRPNVHGFSFPNYTNMPGLVNLTPADVQRMFGDQVCASKTGGICVLTPPVRRWMEQTNTAMNHGHCEGMAVLSQLLYLGFIDPAAFGGKQTYDLRLMGNENLQREIAYWWATQTLSPAWGYRVEGPSAALDQLIKTFREGAQATDAWRIGIRKADGSGGHAVTPFAVEDKGGGLWDVYVYDNNYPGQVRTLQIDRNTDTFAYKAAVNPSVEADLYTGDNLELMALSGRLQQQDCEPCRAEAWSRVVGLATLEQDYYEIWLEGPANLLIEDEDGNVTGFLEGEFVNQIGGARTVDFLYAGVDVWDIDNEPVYLVPQDKYFAINVIGRELAEPTLSTVAMIGPGYFLAVEDIYTEPGDVEALYVGQEGGVYFLRFETNYSESPLIWMGIDEDEADYAFFVQATDLVGENDNFNLALDVEEGLFVLDTTGNTQDSTYLVIILRIDDDGEYVFGGEITISAGGAAYFDYLIWEDDATVMYVGMDYDGDGEIDEEIELEDDADAFPWEWEE